MAKQRPTATEELSLENEPGDEAVADSAVRKEYGYSLEDDVEFPNKREREKAEEEDNLIEDEEEDDFGLWSADTAEDTGLKALLYGPTGGGKTWLAGTFPKPVFLDMEKGLRTLFQLRPVLRYPRDPKREIQTLDEVRDFYKLCRKQSKMENPAIETVVLDSLNEMYHLCVGEVLGAYSANRQYDDQLTMADYGKVNRLFIGITRSFLKLPFHVVMTAVEMPREYEGQETYPKFPGKQIWPELQRMVDQIGYVHVRKGEGGQPEHVVSFRLSPSYVAKDRLGIKVPYIPNNFEAILAAVPAGMVKRT